jgi:hypothetical protein
LYFTDAYAEREDCKEHASVDDLGSFKVSEKGRSSGHIITCERRGYILPNITGSVGL